MSSCILLYVGVLTFQDGSISLAFICIYNYTLFGHLPCPIGKVTSYDHTPSHNRVHAGSECWALFSLIGKALWWTRVAEAGRKLSSCYSPQKQRSVCRCTLKPNWITPVKNEFNLSGLCMFHHGLWMFAATSCPNLDSVCICWKRATETIIPQRERRCENMIEDACLLTARKQLCSSRAQGSENKCQQKGNSKCNKIWILSLCQLGQLGCSRSFKIFKVYYFMLFLHSLPLCQENAEICSNSVYSSAASACTMTYNDTTWDDKTILRSSTIGSNCLVQQCPFVSRTAWRCMTISWVRKPGGQVY